MSKFGGGEFMDDPLLLDMQSYTRVHPRFAKKNGKSRRVCGTETPRRADDVTGSPGSRRNTRCHIHQGDLKNSTVLFSWGR